MIEVFDGDVTRTNGCRNVEVTIDEIGNIHVARVRFNIVGGRSEEVEIVQAVVVSVRAPEPNDYEKDQGGDGQSHGHEDARKSSQFSHDGDRLSKLQARSNGVVRGAVDGGDEKQSAETVEDV